MLSASFLPNAILRLILKCAQLDDHRKWLTYSKRKRRGTIAAYFATTAY